MMAHRIWIETKQEPGTAGKGNLLGCCLVSFHFLWTILSTSTVVSTAAISFCFDICPFVSGCKIIAVRDGERVRVHVVRNWQKMGTAKLKRDQCNFIVIAP